MLFAGICAHGPTLGQHAEELARLAQDYSPRVESMGAQVVVFDASGLERLFGGTSALAGHVLGAARARGWTCGVALAATRTAAVLLACGRPGISLVLPGREAGQLAQLPIALLVELDAWLCPGALAGRAPEGDAPGVDLVSRVAAPVVASPARIVQQGERARSPSSSSEPTAPTSPPPARDQRRQARPRSGGHMHYRLAPVPEFESRDSSPAGGRAAHGGAGSGSRPSQPGTPQAEAEPPSAGGRRQAVGGGREPAGGGRQPDLERRAEAEALREALARWGVSTFGALAALPSDGLRTRLGVVASRWQRLARGEDVRPLVRDPVEERFEEHLVLEWPIEGLEPLSFVLARLLEPLCQHLERRDRGAVGVRLWLKLVTREMFTRYLPLPVPMRDPKVLRTLLMLDLESHAPSAGIDEITLACDVAPGRILQHSLLTRPLPSPDRVSTLVARLTALMGEGRCGSPVVPDTHRPGGFEMRPFVPEVHAAGSEPGRQRDVVPDARVRVAGEGESRAWQGHPAAMLRRFRRPVTAQVTLRDERPVQVSAVAAGVRAARVRQSAGPWRTSGWWWTPETPGRDRGAWDRDEWDVALEDRVVYRLSRSRATGAWTVEGYWD